MVNEQEMFNETLVRMREIWEETGDRLGEFQTDEECLKQAKEVVNFSISEMLEFRTFRFAKRSSG